MDNFELLYENTIKMLETSIAQKKANQMKVMKKKASLQSQGQPQANAVTAVSEEQKEYVTAQIKNEILTQCNNSVKKANEYINKGLINTVYSEIEHNIINILNGQPITESLIKDSESYVLNETNSFGKDVYGGTGKAEKINALIAKVVRGHFKKETKPQQPQEPQQPQGEQEPQGEQQPQEQQPQQAQEQQKQPQVDGKSSISQPITQEEYANYGKQIQKDINSLNGSILEFVKGNDVLKAMYGTKPTITISVGNAMKESKIREFKIRLSEEISNTDEGKEINNTNKGKNNSYEDDKARANDARSAFSVNVAISPSEDKQSEGIDEEKAKQALGEFINAIQKAIVAKVDSNKKAYIKTENKIEKNEGASKVLVNEVDKKHITEFSVSPSNGKVNIKDFNNFSVTMYLIKTTDSSTDKLRTGGYALGKGLGKALTTAGAILSGQMSTLNNNHASGLAMS